MAKLSDAEKEAWLAHAARWRVSGLSLKAYCAQENLKPTTFKSWCYRPANSAVQSAVDAGDLRMLPVKVLSSPPIANSLDEHAIVITHDRGWKVRLPVQLGADFVVQVLRGVVLC